MKSDTNSDLRNKASSTLSRGIYGRETRRCCITVYHIMAAWALTKPRALSPRFQRYVPKAGRFDSSFASSLSRLGQPVPWKWLSIYVPTSGLVFGVRFIETLMSTRKISTYIVNTYYIEENNPNKASLAHRRVRFVEYAIRCGTIFVEF
jgi:hypothetical protein